MSQLKSLQVHGTNGLKLIKRPKLMADISEQVVPLWSETSVEGLIRRFAKTLSLRLGVRRFSFCTLIERGNTVKLLPVEILDDSTAALTRSEIISCENAIGRGVCRDFGHAEKIRVEDEPLLICRLGDNQLTQYIAAFGAPSSAENDFLSLLLIQLQNELRWHQKLAVTTDRIYRDDLTNLYNLSYLEEAIDREIRRGDRFHGEFSLLFFDIDNFKRVNDTFGHLAGSDILRQLARVLRDVLREIDVIVRYGGDEFVALLIGTNSRSGLQVAERLRERISRTEFDVGGGQKTEITVSVGIATYPAHGRTREELLQAADRSMYRSKHLGKNQVSSPVDGGISGAN